MLKEENKILKKMYDSLNLDSVNKSYKISNLERENQKLKEEI
jgi:hypothetical protein